ncbi:hypothetical protein GF407_05045 [candidate division KSB1 bacterium]|nr:hypothetical protein [candidate division KSB1 bacterium]
MNTSCKIEEDVLIQYAFGELNWLQNLHVARHTKTCSTCWQIVEEYKLLQRSFKVTETFSCPDLAVESIRPNQPSRRKTYYWRFAFAAAVIALFAIGLSKIDRTSTSADYSQADVRQAQNDARTAFNVLSRVMGKTGKELGGDVLPQQVAEPLEKSISTLKPLLYGGSS